MFGIGTQELIIILVIVLVIFGAGKLPQLGKSFGQGIRNFKEGMKGEDEAVAATAENRLEKEKLPG